MNPIFAKDIPKYLPYSLKHRSKMIQTSHHNTTILSLWSPTVPPPSSLALDELPAAQNGDYSLKSAIFSFEILWYLNSFLICLFKFTLLPYVSLNESKTKLDISDYLIICVASLQLRLVMDQTGSPKKERDCVTPKTCQREPEEFLGYRPQEM